MAKKINIACIICNNMLNLPSRALSMHSCISGAKLPRSPASAARPNAAIPLARASAEVKDLDLLSPGVNDCGRMLLPFPFVNDDGGDFFFSGMIACCGCSLK